MLERQFSPFDRSPTERERENNACRLLLGATDDVIGTHEGRREGLKKMPAGQRDGETRVSACSHSNSTYR